MSVGDETETRRPMLPMGEATSTAEKADEKPVETYERAVNNRRTELAYALFGGAAVCVVGLIAFVMFAAMHTVDPAVTSTIVVALAGLAAFLVGCARRDLVPYQLLYRSKDHTPSPSVLAETMKGFSRSKDSD